MVEKEFGFKKQIKVVGVILALAFVYSCTLPAEIIEEENFPAHTVTVLNEASSEIFVDFSALSNRGRSYYDYIDGHYQRQVQLDSSYRLAHSQAGLIIRDSIPESKGPLRIDEITPRIRHIDIYKLVNSDTVRATVDLEDFNLWRFANNGSLQPSRKTQHFYRIVILDSHFN